jgi:hypothetical protein
VLAEEDMRQHGGDDRNQRGDEHHIGGRGFDDGADIGDVGQSIGGDDRQTGGTRDIGRLAAVEAPEKIPDPGNGKEQEHAAGKNQCPLVAGRQTQQRQIEGEQQSAEGGDQQPQADGPAICFRTIRHDPLALSRVSVPLGNRNLRLAICRMNNHLYLTPVIKFPQRQTPTCHMLLCVN